MKLRLNQLPRCRGRYAFPETSVKFCSSTISALGKADNETGTKPQEKNLPRVALSHPDRRADACTESRLHTQL